MWNIVGGYGGFYRHAQYSQYEVHVVGSGISRHFELRNTKSGVVVQLVPNDRNANVYAATDHAEEIIDSEVTTT